MEKRNLDSLQTLDDDVLREVVREGEKLLDAQLMTANAADQRAMAWAALLVTGAIAVIGGSAALLVSGKHLALAVVGIVVAAIMGVAISKATNVVRPADWHFPGNRPGNWLPEHWQCHGLGIQCDMHQAMLEQAASLEEQICDNAAASAESGKELRSSMSWALFAVIIGVVAVGMLILMQAVGISGVTVIDPPSAAGSDNADIANVSRVESRH
ncbi:hypothetical protein GCM10011494_37730 [Novosphingobium endophyticum]|uniref:Uncharacterized protein n=1 Tax=Novosphingobium endophyticum TaxID=1955250 RepID=A0A916TYB8_9SPHN|nr:hypothetical protein [Novosphingobium endophyticum]GGC15341.1 hypothetical protein GCM10011494_37730 [Novosphingobium endophyticum]